jgi:hypothetical protein
VVRVRDNGTGIAPEMLGKVFGLFTQVTHPSERRQGGLGIGLSLVDGLVRLHGGRVQAFSAGLDQGSEFVVRLPRLRRERPAAAPVRGRCAPARHVGPGPPRAGGRRQRGRRQHRRRVAADGRQRGRRGARRRRRRGAHRRSGRTWCCWTSACRTSTATRPRGASGGCRACASRC